MPVPQIPEADVRKILDTLRPDWEATGKPVVLAIRGYFRDSMGAPGKNDRGIFDDAFLVFAGGALSRWPGNTDPSGYARGRAVLNPGNWEFAPGIHGITHPDGGYPAFRQPEGYSFTVTRDGEGEAKGEFAINLHRGSPSGGTSSLGCQTVPVSSWPKFKKTLQDALGISDDDCRRHPLGIPGKRVLYTLATRAQVEQILGRSL